MICSKSHICFKVSMNLYNSYKQIFNQNEGIPDRRNNEKIKG